MFRMCDGFYQLIVRYTYHCKSSSILKFWYVVSYFSLIGLVAEPFTSTAERENPTSGWNISQIVFSADKLHDTQTNKLLPVRNCMRQLEQIL